MFGFKILMEEKIIDMKDKREDQCTYYTSWTLQPV